jgi:hypothetical protein
MRHFALVRSTAAVVLGLGLTALFGGCATLFAPPVRVLAWLIEDEDAVDPHPLADPLRRAMARLELIPKRWSAALKERVYQGIMGVTAEVNGLDRLRPARSGEVTIVIANHPATTAAALFCWLVTRHLAPRPVFTAKFAHLTIPLYAPFFGWAMWATRTGLFIRRFGNSPLIRALRFILPRATYERIQAWCREDTRRSIRSGASILTPGSCLVLFPDQHRPNAKRIKKDREKFGDTFPGTTTPITHTLVPRSGGLAEFLSAIDAPVRIIDVTNAMSTHDNGMVEAGRQVGSTWYVDATDVEPPSRDETALRAWLNDRWARKHRLIEAWRSEAAVELSEIEDTDPVIGRATS